MKAKRTCHGYRDQLSLAFRDETKKVARKVNATKVSQTSRPSAVSSDADMSAFNGYFTAESLTSASNDAPAFQTTTISDAFELADSSDVGGQPNGEDQSSIGDVGPSLQTLSVINTCPSTDEAMAFFFHHYVSPESTTGNGHLNFLLKRHQSQLANSLLKDVITSIGMAGLSTTGRGRSFMLEAHEQHAIALRSTNSALMESSRVTSDEALIAVMLLALYEVISALLPGPVSLTCR